MSMKKFFYSAAFLAAATVPAAAADIAIVHAGKLLAVPGGPVTTNQSVNRFNHPRVC